MSPVPNHSATDAKFFVILIRDLNYRLLIQKSITYTLGSIPNLFFIITSNLSNMITLFKKKLNKKLIASLHNIAIFDKNLMLDTFYLIQQDKKLKELYFNETLLTFSPVKLSALVYILYSNRKVSLQLGYYKKILNFFETFLLKNPMCDSTLFGYYSFLTLIYNYAQLSNRNMFFSEFKEKESKLKILKDIYLIDYLKHRI